MNARTFHLERNKDVSGVSGCGIVAEGVLWSDGECALHWLGNKKSTTTYHKIDDLIEIHGHNGCTKIVFDD